MIARPEHRNNFLLEQYLDLITVGRDLSDDICLCYFCACIHIKFTPLLMVDTKLPVAVSKLYFDFVA